MSDEEIAKDESDLEDGDLLEEPEDSARLSPYAIAAFGVGILGLWLSPQSLFPPFEALEVRVVFLGWLPQALPALAASGVALWAARKAEEEIFLSEARFGGVGLYRTGRVLAIVTIAVIVLGLAARAGGDPFAVQVELPTPETPPPPADFINP